VARVLVRLKLRLLASMFRSWSAAIGYVLPVVYGLPVAVALAVALVVTGRSGSVDGPPLLVTGLATLAVGWTVGPLLAGGLDSTVDPDALTLFPLTPFERARGLLAAGAVGVAPLATAVVCLGAIAGFAPAGPGAVVVVVAAAVDFVLCLLLARAVTATVSGALSGRRRRDVLTLVGFLAVIALSQLPNLAVHAGLGGRTGPALRHSARIAGYLPWGWAGHAISDAHAGHLLPSLGWLLAAVVLTLGVAVRWMHALATTGDGSAAITVGSGRTTGLDTPLSRLLPAGPLRACVAKDQRYLARDPMLRMSVISVFLAGLLSAVALGSTTARHAPFVVAVIGPLAGLATANCLGVDRGASWTLLATGVSWRTVLTSKVLSFSAIFVPAMGLLVVAAALAARTVHLIPVAFLLGLAMYAAALGGTVYGSVLFPAPLPIARAGAGIFGSRTGGNGTTNLLQSVLLLGALAVTLPALLAVAITAGETGGAQTSATALAAVGALAYGGGLFAVGFTLALRRLAGRGPEMVAALSAQRT
jgi:ABC-2 type transport system permease protein